jgi:calmodulin
MEPVPPSSASPSATTPRKASLKPSSKVTVVDGQAPEEEEEEVVAAAAAPPPTAKVAAAPPPTANARQQRATIVVKQGFTPEQMVEFQSAFALFDSDSSGSISATELGVVMESLGQKMMPSDLKKIVAECDTDGDGTIDFDEFVTMMARKMKCAPNTEEEMREVFHLFDEDNSGSISSSELRHLLKTLGGGLSQGDVNEIVKAIDINGDGEIDYEEFITAMKSDSSVVAKFKTKIALVQNVNRITKRHGGAWIGKIGGRGNWSCCGDTDSYSTGCPRHPGAWDALGHWDCCCSRDQNIPFCKLTSVAIKLEPVKQPPTEAELKAIRKKQEQDALEDVADEKRAALEERKKIRKTFIHSPWKAAAEISGGGVDDNWLEQEEIQAAAKKLRAAAKRQAVLDEKSMTVRPDHAELARQMRVAMAKVL